MFSIQPLARVLQRGVSEGAAETYVGLEGEPCGRPLLQVGLREQPLEVNGK